MSNKYNNLLQSISEKLDTENQTYVSNNITDISNNLIKLSEFFNDYMNVSGMEKLNKDAKYNLMKTKLDLLNINRNQFHTLIEKTDFKNIQQGGAPVLDDQQAKNLKKLQDEFVAQQMKSCLTNIPALLQQLAKSGPKIFMDLLYELGGSVHTFFQKGIDWVYFWLFITASIPVGGMLSDFIIVVKGLAQGDYFLATITAVTGTMSTILNMHILDLGIWFKIFYYLDRKGADLRKSYNQIIGKDQCGGGVIISEHTKMNNEVISAKYKIDSLINIQMHGGFDETKFYSPKNIINYTNLSEFEAKKKVLKFSSEDRKRLKKKYSNVWSESTWNQKLNYLNQN